jgi:hypothetical protein
VSDTVETCAVGKERIAALKAHKAAAALSGSEKPFPPLSSEAHLHTLHKEKVPPLYPHC